MYINIKNCIVESQVIKYFSKRKEEHTYKFWDDKNVRKGAQNFDTTG